MFNSLAESSLLNYLLSTSIKFRKCLRSLLITLIFNKTLNLDFKLAVLKE